MPNETVSSTNNCLLTTIDNPFDPFDDFTSWFLFDIEKGYDSCGKVMRIAKLSDDLTEKEEDVEIERAIDEIIKYDPLDIYKKVTRKIESSTQTNTQEN